MSDLNKEGLRPLSMADSEKTAAPSVEPSVFESKEIKEARESVIPSTTASVREKSAEPEDATAAEKKSTEDGAAEDNEDGFEYPKAWRLAFISVALCLSVFCMALVSFNWRWR